MTVRRTQNSGIPASTQTTIDDITDGTSNTMARSSQTKPGSKDVFETSGLKAGASEVLYETFTARGEANGLKADSNEVAVEGFAARGEAIRKRD